MSVWVAYILYSSLTGGMDVFAEKPNSFSTWQKKNLQVKTRYPMYFLLTSVENYTIPHS